MGMKYRPLVDYDVERNEFILVVPTEELHEKARVIPGIHERKAQGVWAAPATAGVAARVISAYGPELEGTTSFLDYVRDQIARNNAALEARGAKHWPPIPITKLQPVGEWMHQRKAFWFAYYLDGAMLAVTMGGGKTKVAIDLMVNWQARTVLIISPMAAIEDVWVPHIEKHGPDTYSLAYRHPKHSVTDFTEIANKHMHEYYLTPVIIIINHEAFWRQPFRAWAIKQEWDLVIDDEIHREKSAGSLQSNFLFQLGAKTRRRLGLTGTPMPHSPLDVYGQYRFLDRGIFGTNHNKFEAQYAEYGGYMDREVVGFKNLDDLNRKFYTIGISIDDSEQGLPKTVDLTHHVNLEAPARALYKELDKEFIVATKSGEITAANAGVKFLRLQQLACGIATWDKDGKKKIEQVSTAKLNGLRDLLQDFKKDEPIVIFCRFTPEVKWVKEVCRKMRRSVAELSGKVNELQLWKKGEADILVAQIQAAKEGIDLTRASVAIFHSTGISLGDYEQCRKRLHRPPQKRMVRFIHIIARATRDVVTMRALKERKDVIREALRSNREGS